VKREAKLLLGKAVDSLVLGIELFNRPSDRGRVEAVLIHLDHAFEMLLKSAILHKEGRIRERGEPTTIGFDHCVRVGLSEGRVRFLGDDDAVVLRAVNTLRDAAQHHLVSLSEQQLYLHAQASLTLFRSIMRDVLGQNLAVELPERVLPLSTTPPVDLATLFDTELDEVKKLLEPGKRHRLEAMAKLRSLAIVNGAIEGKTTQPTVADLHKLGSFLLKGKSLHDLFPGIATVNLTASGSGIGIELRITKNQGIPVQLVREEVAPSVPVIAVKRVDELGFYSLGRDDLADKVNLSGMMTSAMIWNLDLQNDPDCHKEICIGKSRFHRYSQKAIAQIKQALENGDQAAVWSAYRARKKIKAAPVSVATGTPHEAPSVPA
jgi:hypothetical protein